jgi:hypothetical protein
VAGPNLGAPSHYGKGEGCRSRVLAGSSANVSRFREALRMIGREMVPWQCMEEAADERCLGET